MKPESLVASAGINFGLALVVIFLFSVLKKQPSNALIYYARRIAKGDHPRSDHSLTLSRFLPSVSWIRFAFRISEEEVLRNNGLDALVVLRLFKFGINFFGVASLVGLAILVPVNYGDRDEPSRVSHSMDYFSITNIRSGSNRLWVHFTCLWVISFYGLFLLYKEYNGIMVRRILQMQNLRHRPDQFTVLVRQIPLCSEHKALACSVDHVFSEFYPDSYYSCQIVYDGKHIVGLMDQVKYIGRKLDDLRERSKFRRRNKEGLLLEACQEDDCRIVLLEEKLRELFNSIHQLQDLNMLKGKELPVAFVTFKSRRGAALAAQSQQHPHPLLWITERAPEPGDISWRGLGIPFRILPVNNIGVIASATLLTIFFAAPVTAIQGIAKFEKIKKWFPPAMAIELIPGLRSIVTGYLPGAILNGFVYIVSFAMLGMAKMGGSVSKSKEEIKATNMFFYFLVGNVFFLSLVSGSLLEEIGESFAHPKNFPSHLASAVSAQADFFATYILTDSLSGFSLEILQPGMLLLDFILLHTIGRVKDDNPYLYSLPYFRIIPSVAISILIGMVYAVVTPLLLPFLIGYFCLGYIVYVNQIEDVYETSYETCGEYWPYVHHYIFVSIILMQISAIGLFGLKSKPAASIATIPLLVFTFMFNEYCKIRFLPTFQHYPVKDAFENDELDQKSGGQLEANCENARSAYRPPWLRPVSSILSESNLTQPLFSSV